MLRLLPPKPRRKVGFGFKWANFRVLAASLSGSPSFARVTEGFSHHLINIVTYSHKIFIYNISVFDSDNLQTETFEKGSSFLIIQPSFLGIML